MRNKFHIALGLSIYALLCVNESAAQTANSSPSRSGSTQSPAEVRKKKLPKSEPPCPIKQNLEKEITYGAYKLRTYRTPNGEGCLRITKDEKSVFYLESMAFKIGGNFYRDPGIPVGTDITGEGKADAIVGEWSGGVHCCFTLRVFELGDQFRKIGEIKADDADGARFLDPGKDGHYQFEGVDWAFAYWRTSFMESPAPRIVLKYRDGGFHLALDSMKKPEPSSAKIAGIVRAIQSDEEWERDVSSDCNENCSVPVALWANMLDLMYSGHPNLAWKLFDESWPPSRQGKTSFAKDFCKQLHGSHYWSDLKAEIGACPAIR
jgi:hypothetical protein